jgi:hypothetical protein
MKLGKVTCSFGYIAWTQWGKKSNEGKKKKGAKRQHHEDDYNYSCTRVQALVSSQGRTLSQPKRHSNVLSLCVRVAHIQWVFGISVSCANSLKERESKVIKSCDNLFQHRWFLGAHLICPPQNLNLWKKNASPHNNPVHGFTSNVSQQDSGSNPRSLAMSAISTHLLQLKLLARCWSELENSNVQMRV